MSFSPFLPATIVKTSLKYGCLIKKSDYNVLGDKFVDLNARELEVCSE